MTLTEAIRSRYPYDDYLGVDLRSVVERLCRNHIDRGLGDRDIEQRLCSQDDGIYWQQFTEVLLAHEMSKVGIDVVHRNIGPDFLLIGEGRKVWVEVIVPKPEGLPSLWLTRNVNTAQSMPHEAILLRWTAAIKEKAEKLTGNPDRNVKGYLTKGIVAPEDAYVIAVNGCMLRHPPFPQLMGISQFPFAVEAVFPVGPVQVTIDRTTLQTRSVDHQYRPLIPKPGGRTVPATMFLNPAFKNVSAIWAVDINENLLLGRTCPMAVVHNPEAANPISARLLPAQSEYVAVNQGDSYLLERQNGRLS